jgi:DNA-binding response OmpR family regulator
MSHILLVEPDRLLADIYKQALCSREHEVIMCATAQSAISAADVVLPDVVILEVQLIEHSGIEFLYEFRSYPEWQQVPVFFLTNVPPIEFESSRKLLKQELGVAKYLYKPMTSLQTILNTVQELATA